MSSTFGGYNIAVSGMYVNQAGLTVTSHNLSNVNTAGYSRQRMIGEEQNIMLTGGVSVGAGVDAGEIRRARSQFLDKSYRQQNSQSSYWEAKTANLEDMQNMISEFTTTDGTKNKGLQQTLQDFFDSWQQLTKDAGSQTSRSSVIENATYLVGTLDQIDKQLTQLQQDAAGKVKTSVKQLNDMADQVAALNAKITEIEASGAEAGDLRDQRDQLLDKMSSLADVGVNETSEGVLSVTIGGVAIVCGNDVVNRLTATGTGMAGDPLLVQWAGMAGVNINLTGGSMEAYLEDADQSGVQTIDQTILPYNFFADPISNISTLRQGLNDLITTIAAGVNQLHRTGTGLDGSTGLDFFVAADAGKPLGLGNIEVNPALQDGNGIAASASGAAGDNTIASQIAKLTENKIFANNGLSMDTNTFYQSLISWLGTTGEDAAGNYNTQNNLTHQVDNQRQQISGVSADEEMSNMIVYQNAYSASARVLYTIDSLVADLIQSVG